MTVITPIAPDHRGVFERCRASVEAQIYPVEHLYMVDEERRGPGYVRNRLLEQVTTPFVTFLDADDWIQPDFSTLMLSQARHDRYTYCDWFQHNEVKEAPRTGIAWCQGTFHLVTSVIPTAEVRRIGGFNEVMRGMEDTDFYIRLCLNKICGIRIEKPLVHYSPGGGRSQGIHDSGEVEMIKEKLRAEYGGFIMPCCGDFVQQNPGPVGDKLEGDILAQAQWKGNHSKMGTITGRQYARTSYPKMTWVDPRDVDAAPQNWRAVEEYNFDKLPDPPKEDKKKLEGIAGLMSQMEAVGIFQPAQVKEVIPAVMPNTRKVLRLISPQEYPIFVSPRKEYQSYTDFWRLVELSGFERRYYDEVVHDDASHTYIFVSPEGIPDCSETKAKTIFWQLEYAGEYTNQQNKHTVDEVWSSDPYHAKQNGHKFVLLGSHPGLNPNGQRGGGKPYDMVMLSYMTPRRQVIRQKLKDYNWPPVYPGHGPKRHAILSNSNIMIYVHQHDTPAIAPLRFALAAAYQMTMISEKVPDMEQYHKLAWFVDYDYIPVAAEQCLKGLLEYQDVEGMAARLHDELCLHRPFGDNVMEALK